MPESVKNRVDRALTHRQQLIELLENGTHSCRELSQLVHQSEKEVLNHLEHLRRSLNARGRRLIIKPAACRHCGYTFEQRQRLTKPGKCPSCRRTDIEPPTYRISEPGT